MFTRSIAVLATAGLLVAGGTALATSASAEPGKGQGQGQAPAGQQKKTEQAGSPGGGIGNNNNNGGAVHGDNGGNQLPPGENMNGSDLQGGTGHVAVDICHATRSASNPYVLITVDFSSVDEAMLYFQGKLKGEGGGNGHGDHVGFIWDGHRSGTNWGDIIEPVVYGGVTYYPGLNLDSYSAALQSDGRTLLANGCQGLVSATATGSGSMTICVDGSTTVATWTATTTGTGTTPEAAKADAESKLPAALEEAKQAELAKYPGYVEGQCKGDFEGSANGSGSMGICVSGQNVAVSWSATTTGFGVTQELADANAAALLPAALQSAKDAELAKYPGYVEGACPGSVQAQASGSGSLAICLNDQDIPVLWSAATTGFGADQAAAEAAAQAALPAALEAARAAELAKYAGYTEGSCATGVTAVQPATVAAPAPATVAVPAAATLPASVPAGEGSGNGLPMWALAMIAVAMIGAAATGARALGARQ